MGFYSKHARRHESKSAGRCDDHGSGGSHCPSQGSNGVRRVFARRNREPIHSAERPADGQQDAIEITPKLCLFRHFYDFIFNIRILAKPGIFVNFNSTGAPVIKFHFTFKFRSSAVKFYSSAVTFPDDTC